jgi:hypothetical protein
MTPPGASLYRCFVSESKGRLRATKRVYEWSTPFAKWCLLGALAERGNLETIVRCRVSVCRTVVRPSQDSPRVQVGCVMDAHGWVDFITITKAPIDIFSRKGPPSMYNIPGIIGRSISSLGDRILHLSDEIRRKIRIRYPEIFG